MKALIIVRGGDKSLHQQWLLTPKEKRSYDVALSYFGSNPDFWKDRCDIFHHCSGSKWEGLSDFIKKYKDIFSSYDYIWLPDDDLIMHNSDVEKFFSICRKNDFIISQPSLMKYSFYSWKITLQHKLYSFRETNFVEIMAPCFKASSFSIGHCYKSKSSI